MKGYELFISKSNNFLKQPNTNQGWRRLIKKN